MCSLFSLNQYYIVGVFFLLLEENYGLTHYLIIIWCPIFRSGIQTSIRARMMSQLNFRRSMKLIKVLFQTSSLFCFLDTDLVYPFLLSSDRNWWHCGTLLYNMVLEFLFPDSLYHVFPVLSDPITRLEYDFSGGYEINQYTARVRASSLTRHHILILGVLC
jgi:hypothetical protein